MFKKNFSTKQQGNVGIGYAIAYFTRQGYTVSLPLNDSQDYDLVVDIDSQLNRVQVKTTRQKTRYGIYRVSLRSLGGSSRSVYGRVCDSSCSLLFVLCEDSSQYVIPRDAFKGNRNTICLGKLYEQFRVVEPARSVT